MPGLLFFAVVLKATGPSFAQDGGLAYALVAFELALGVWLMCGVGSLYSRSTAAVTFAAFCLYNVWLLFERDKFCGCFGAVHVSPPSMVVLDLVIAALLVYFQADATFTSSDSFAAPRILSPLACKIVGTSLTVLTSVAFAIYMGETVSKTSIWSVDPSQRIVVLDPAPWVGHMLPVGNYLDISKKLTSGDAVLIFYDKECMTCKRALPEYEGFAKNRPDLIFAKVVLAGWEPDNPALGTQVKDWAIKGHLNKDHEWFATTPCVLKLHDGSVIAYREGEAAVNPLWLLN